jgi:hypothetical protein
MSKTHTKKNTLTAAMSDGLSSVEPSHVFERAEASNTTAEVNSGGDVFAIIPDMSRVGQVTSYRALANGAIAAAIYIAHDLLGLDREEGEKFDELNGRLVKQCELYNIALGECGTLAQSDFEMPMDFDTMFDLLANSSAQRKSAELPDEVLEALGITRSQLRLIDAEGERERQARDQALRASLRDNADGIRAEVESIMGSTDAADVSQFLDSLDVNTHAALFRKLYDKLSAAQHRALKNRDRYSAGLSDAMLLTSDIKIADKANTAFLRRNAGALRDVA